MNAPGDIKKQTIDGGIKKQLVMDCEISNTTMSIGKISIDVYALH